MSGPPKSTDPLNSLLASCDSIISAALSYRTLAPEDEECCDVDDDEMDCSDEGIDDETVDPSPPHPHPHPHRSLRNALALEERVATWLDGQLLEAERRTRKPPPPAPPTATGETPPSANNGTETEKQARLLTETGRLQMEHLLLSRRAVSRSAGAALFPPTGEAGASSPRQPNGDSPAPLPDGEPQLLLQSLQARDRRALEALELHRRLDILRRELHDAQRDLTEVMANNRTLWATRRDLRERHHRHDRDDNGASASHHHQRRPRSDSETAAAGPHQLRARVLQRLMADLIACGSLDWYHDERLRRILKL